MPNAGKVEQLRFTGVWMKQGVHRIFSSNLLRLFPSGERRRRRVTRFTFSLPGPAGRRCMGRDQLVAADFFFEMPPVCCE